MMDPTCEVNEKGIREKNDGNEVVEEGSSPPLDLNSNEATEVDEETLPYAEEDWQEPEPMEVPKNLEPDLPFTIQTRQSGRTRLTKKNNPYGDDFVVDRIDLKKIVEEVVGLEEITMSRDIDIVDDRDEEWIDDPVQARSRIRRRATAIPRTRLDKSACLGRAERKDIRPKGDHCLNSRCRPREHEIHKNRKG